MPVCGCYPESQRFTDAVARLHLCGADPGQESSVCRYRYHHHRAGDRSQHGHLQRNQRRAAAAASLQEPRPAGLRYFGHAEAQCQRLPALQRQLPRPAQRHRGRVRRTGRRQHRPRHGAARGPVPRADSLGRRDDELLPVDGRTNRARPGLHGRRWTAATRAARARRRRIRHPAAQGPPLLPQMAILSYAYWQRRFGGNASIVGHPMPGAIGGQGGTQIVGVLKPGFELLFPPDANMEQRPDVWFANRVAYDNAGRNGVSLRAIGRLKDGVTRERAQGAVDRVAADLRRNFIILGTSGLFIRLEPMHRHVVEEVRPALLALMGAVIFLLLIACANVANLLLVRASLRERELAIRTALGGSWWRLVSQTLAEAVLLAFTGALLGLGLAWVGIHELRAIAPASLPRLDAN